MRTSVTKTRVVDELAALLAARRATAAQRSGGYRRLALAILDPAASSRTAKPVPLRNIQQPVAAA